MSLTNSFRKPQLICWTRSPSAVPSPLSGGPCLWSTGFLLNSRELIALAGAPSDVTPSDLLAALYERYGLETARLITGPFAWILWDERHRRMVAALDRLGTREIYYAVQGREIYFAENVKSILAALSGKPKPNADAVVGHIHGLQLLPGETFYKGIQALRPGEVLTATPDCIETRLYWRPEPQPLLKLPHDEAYAAAFRERVLPVVAEYAPREPAGVTLSGGIDSTTVAVALRKAVPRFTAFLWASPELPDADESTDAAHIAGTLQFPVVAVPAGQHWPLRGDPGIRPAAESPSFNLFSETLEATYQAASQRGIQVLFSGYGGDSLFGDNVFSYPDLLLTGRWSRLVTELREHLPHSRMGWRGVVRRMILGPIAKIFIPSLNQPAIQTVPWLGPGMQMPVVAIETPRWMLPGRRERLRILRSPYLPSIARLTTTHAARHGINLCHPLIDHRIIEFALSLPSSQTFKAAQRKVIVRNAMRGILPATVVERRDKIYPAAIAHRGLRERETAKVWALMTNMRAAEMGFVNEARLREEYQRYLDGKTQSTLFWHTLTLEAWLRLYF